MTDNLTFTYTVAIRTLGTSGERYKKLLNSIEALVPAPDQVIVVLPEGYSAPKETLGYEQFLFCPKGMINQRLYALSQIESEYILFCDDDVSFDSNFVRKLVDPLVNNHYDCSAGPLLDFFPPKNIKYLLASLLGGACVMLHGRKRDYVRILNTGGWSYNRNINLNKHQFYRTESLPWTCFFIKRTAIENIHFEDEMWCEQHGYAAFEDRVMFYKMILNGYKICVVSDALYFHNDGKTSTNDTNLKLSYIRTFNHYVFWHRCLYNVSQSISKKIWQRICITYYEMMQKLYALRSKEIQYQVCDGFRDAKKYINSHEYRNLPNIIIEE